MAQIEFPTNFAAQQMLNEMNSQMGGLAPERELNTILTHYLFRFDADGNQILENNVPLPDFFAK